MQKQEVLKIFEKGDYMYVSVPKDLMKIKEKVVFKLTRRQLVCFGIGAALGGINYGIVALLASTTLGMYVLVASILPWFVISMYEKDGLPFEKVMKYFLLAKFYRRPRRIYKTSNLYTYLMKEGENNASAPRRKTANAVKKPVSEK